MMKSFLRSVLIATVLIGIVSCQDASSSSSTRNPYTESSTNGPITQLLGMDGFVRSFIQAFEMLMRQVSSIRGLFIGMGQEMARITFNNSVAQPFLPVPYVLNANKDRQDSLEEIEVPEESTGSSIIGVPIPSSIGRFAQIYQQWVEQTGSALTRMFREVFNMYQGAITAFVNRGQMTRDQVLRGFQALRQNLESFGNSVSGMVPNLNVSGTINNIFSEMNQNITNFLNNFSTTAAPTTVVTLAL